MSIDFETAAQTMYPDMPGDQQQETEPGSLAGRGAQFTDEDNPQARETETVSDRDAAEALYGNEGNEKSLADRYYSSLKNSDTFLDFADEFSDPGMDYGELHEQLSTGLHRLGVNDVNAERLMGQILNAQRETDEAAEERATEVKQFLRMQGPEFFNDLGLMGTYLEQAFGRYGQGWREALEASADVSTLQLLRDLAQNKRRADSF